MDLDLKSLYLPTTCKDEASETFPITKVAVRPWLSAFTNES